jgi:hypothetical protein
MPVAKATRHARKTQGFVFNPGLSMEAIGQYANANLDREDVSR